MKDTLQLLLPDMPGVSSQQPPMFRRKLNASTDPLRQQICQAQQQGNFADVQITINDTVFRWHKLILSVQSNFFNEMFHDSEPITRVSEELSPLDVEALKLVIDYMYSGNIQFEFLMAKKVLKVVRFFQLFNKCLEEKISKYVIDNLCTDNCLGWFEFGVQENMEKIKLKAKYVFINKFSEVISTSEFVELTFDRLAECMTEMMQSRSNHDEGLNAFASWVEYDASNRSQRFEEILRIVDLKKCSTTVLEDLDKKYDNFRRTDMVKKRTSASLSLDSDKSRHIIVAGGRLTEGSCNGQTWVLNLETGESILKASKKIPNFYAAICAVPDGLICAGGSPTKLLEHSIADCVLYNKNIDKWVDLPSLPFPTYGAGATCVIGHYLVVMGGCKEPKGQTLCLDLRARDEWSVYDSMPHGMSLPIVCSVNHCIFVIYSSAVLRNEPHGEDNKISLQCFNIGVECYDTPSLGWTMKSPLPDAIPDTGGAQAVSKALMLYLVGGHPQNKLCARYDPCTNNWTVLKAPSLSHYGGAALVMNKKIILSGGKWGKKAHNHIEEYDTDTNSWTKMPFELPEPLYLHCMVNLV